MVRKSPPLWEVSGRSSGPPAPSPTPSDSSIQANPVHTTDEAAQAVYSAWKTLAQFLRPIVEKTGEATLAHCLDKNELARFLGLSVRSLTRADAMKLLPAPDLVVGRSPRWSPSTIERWLKSKPRLPGRTGGRCG